MGGREEARRGEAGQVAQRTGAAAEPAAVDGGQVAADDGRAEGWEDAAGEEQDRLGKVHRGSHTG